MKPWDNYFMKNLSPKEQEFRLNVVSALKKLKEGYVISWDCPDGRKRRIVHMDAHNLGLSSKTKTKIVHPEWPGFCDCFLDIKCEFHCYDPSIEDLPKWLDKKTIKTVCVTRDKPNDTYKHQKRSKNNT
jgi:hypothetical protein